MTYLKNIQVRTDEDLIYNFETGDKPTGREFAEFIISKAHINHTHKGEDILINGNSLNEILELLVEGISPELSIKSPNGTIYKIVVDDEGRLYTSPTKRKRNIK